MLQQMHTGGIAVAHGVHKRRAASPRAHGVVALRPAEVIAQEALERARDSRAARLGRLVVHEPRAAGGRGAGVQQQQQQRGQQQQRPPPARETSARTGEMHGEAVRGGGQPQRADGGGYKQPRAGPRAPDAATPDRHTRARRQRKDKAVVRR